MKSICVYISHPSQSQIFHLERDFSNSGIFTFQSLQVFHSSAEFDEWFNLADVSVRAMYVMLNEG